MPKYTACLSKTTTDQIKSKIMSPELVQLVLDVYMTPDEFASLVKRFFEDTFQISFEEER